MNQRGAVPLLILLGTIGLIVFIAVSTIGPFKNNFLSNLFPKQFSFAASTPPPTGRMDRADDLVIGGWAKDPDYNGPIYIHIYVDGAFVFAQLANIYRPDVGSFAFHWNHPTFGAGNHQVVAYAIGVDSSGIPDGVNPALGNISFAGNCSRTAGVDLGWCTNNPNYYINRQRDTKILWSPYISIGVDNSYGGTVTQLYDKDASTNLITEHGGGAVQLSLWGYDANPAGFGYFAINGNQKCDPTPYSSVAACLASNPGANCSAGPAAGLYPIGQQITDCQAIKPCPGWSPASAWNPIQAGGVNCGWDSPTNDVTASGYTPDGGWQIFKQNPYHYTKTNETTGVSFYQKVSLGDIFAKIDYVVENKGPLNMGYHPQEMPALYPAPGMDSYFYYYGGANPYQNFNSPVERFSLSPFSVNPAASARSVGVPNGKLFSPLNYRMTEHWWGVCNSDETRCITTLTFSSLNSQVDFRRINAGGGYITPIGNFALASGSKHEFSNY